MSIRFLILSIALFLTTAVQGQNGNQNIAFKDGEVLRYIVSYKIGIFNTDVATVVFETVKTTYSGQPVFHINAVGKMSDSYRWFFDMRDEYNTRLDVNTLRPLFFDNNIKEGDYRYMSSMVYDWINKVVDTKSKKLNSGIEKAKQMPLSPSSFDGLALFFNLRNTDLRDIQPGCKSYIDLVTADTITRLQYKFIGREVKHIPRLGRFKTLRFVCQLAKDESFKDGSEFTIWFSDDDNKIPLYIESPIRVGSIKGRLESWQNLANPFSSVTN